MRQGCTGRLLLISALLGLLCVQALARYRSSRCRFVQTMNVEVIKSMFDADAAARTITTCYLSQEAPVILRSNAHTAN